MTVRLMEAALARVSGSRLLQTCNFSPSQEPLVMPEPTPSENDAILKEYNQLAASYDRRWRAYVDETVRVVIESVALRGDERILDIACGTGELERLLLARWPGLQIVGTDICEGMLREAARKAECKTVSWLRAGASDLPQPNGSFDCVLCANSFHYFRSPVETLAEVRRVLRPNGQFVLVDWCDNYLICKLCSLWLRLTDRTFFRLYTLPDCRRQLEQSGLEVVGADRFRVGWIWGLMRVVCRRTP